MIELDNLRRLFGSHFLEEWLLGFTYFLWRAVVYPCNKDQEKRLMKV